MAPSVKLIEESRVFVPDTAAGAAPALGAGCAVGHAPAHPAPHLLRLRRVREDHPAVDALRASLAATVSRFPPLAGRIVHQPATGDAAIDCTAAGVAAGVRFLVAEMISDAVAAARLAGDEDHDAEVFVRLVPELDAGELPAETMAAQVTRLRVGLALGVAVHHAVADGRSVWRFLEAWAAACRGEDDGDAEPPAFDRAARSSRGPC